MTGEEFMASLASDSSEKARFEAYTDQLQKNALNELGVHIEKAELAGLPSVKLFAITSEIIGDVWKEMERDLASVRNAKKTKELVEAVSDPSHSQHDSELARLNALPPHARMSAARELNAAQPVQEVRVMTAEDRQKAIADINRLPFHMRIQAARKAGL